MSDLQLKLLAESCRTIRLYLPSDPRTPEEREDDPDAELIGTVIDGTYSGEKPKEFYFTATYKPHVRFAKVLRGALVKLLSDQLGDPRLSISAAARENMADALTQLDEWLNTPIVDRISRLA